MIAPMGMNLSRSSPPDSERSLTPDAAKMQHRTGKQPNIMTLHSPTPSITSDNESEYAPSVVVRDVCGRFAPKYETGRTVVRPVAKTPIRKSRSASTASVGSLSAPLGLTKSPDYVLRNSNHSSTLKAGTNREANISGADIPSSKSRTYMRASALTYNEDSDDSEYKPRIRTTSAKKRTSMGPKSDDASPSVLRDSNGKFKSSKIGRAKIRESASRASSSHSRSEIRSSMDSSTASTPAITPLRDLNGKFIPGNGLSEDVFVNEDLPPQGYRASIPQVIIYQKSQNIESGESSKVHKDGGPVKSELVSGLESTGAEELPARPQTIEAEAMKPRRIKSRNISSEDNEEAEEGSEDEIATSITASMRNSRRVNPHPRPDALDSDGRSKLSLSPLARALPGSAKIYEGQRHYERDVDDTSDEDSEDFESNKASLPSVKPQHSSPHAKPPYMKPQSQRSLLLEIEETDSEDESIIAAVLSKPKQLPSSQSASLNDSSPGSQTQIEKAQSVRSSSFPSAAALRADLVNSQSARSSPNYNGISPGSRSNLTNLEIARASLLKGRVISSGSRASPIDLEPAPTSPLKPRVASSASRASPSNLDIARASLLKSQGGSGMKLTSSPPAQSSPRPGSTSSGAPVAQRNTQIAGASPRLDSVIPKAQHNAPILPPSRVSSIRPSILPTGLKAKPANTPPTRTPPRTNAITSTTQHSNSQPASSASNRDHVNTGARHENTVSGGHHKPVNDESSDENSEGSGSEGSLSESSEAKDSDSSSGKSDFSDSDVDEATRALPLERPNPEDSESEESESSDSDSEEIPTHLPLEKSSSKDSDSEEWESVDSDSVELKSQSKSEEPEIPRVGTSPSKKRSLEDSEESGQPSKRIRQTPASTATLVQDGDEDEDSAEEEIVTAGARATLANSGAELEASRPRIIYEGNYDPDGEDDNFSDEGSETASEVEIEESVEDPEEDQEDVAPRHVGFPPVEELPEWFPENLKQMYRIDRHGGALSYKELNEITRYRAALEVIYRRKWRRYIVAGKARFELQKAIHSLKVRPLTKKFYKYRKQQFRSWKEKALKLWKRLEKYHRGMLILDETIKINFRQERVMWEHHLRERWTMG